jgi:hypothetical protein
VKAEVAARKTEVATGCAKHANVKAEVAARKAEVATGNVKHDRLFSYQFTIRNSQFAIKKLGCSKAFRVYICIRFFVKWYQKCIA